MQHFCPIAEPSGRVPPRGGTGSRQCLCWTPSSTISSRYHPTLRARKACCCARSSPLQSQKRRLLVCPVLYRNGAPEEIRTPDPQIRRLVTEWRTKGQAAAEDLQLLQNPCRSPVKRQQETAGVGRKNLPM